jgi:Spy/CpxP family protein refolding chaperone
VKRSIAILSVVGLFVIGILIGSLGAHLYYSHRLLQPDGPPGMGGKIFMDRLLTRLDLTPEQRREIEEILDESHARADEFRRSMAPEVRALMEQTHERLLAVLTPEQREIFEEMRRTHHQRAREWFLGGHRPGHGRGHGHGLGPGPPGPPPPPPSE